LAESALKYAHEGTEAKVRARTAEASSRREQTGTRPDVEAAPTAGPRVGRSDEAGEVTIPPGSLKQSLTRASSEGTSGYRVAVGHGGARGVEVDDDHRNYIDYCQTLYSFAMIDML